MSLTLLEECRLRVFENWILGRVFGPKRDENVEWRGLHNEQDHWLYRSPRLRWAGRVARMEEGRNIFKILTGKPTERNLQRCPGVNRRNWVDSAQDRNY
jgi:hypothetical protein